jgi:hypothetical protein
MVKDRDGNKKKPALRASLEENMADVTIGDEGQHRPKEFDISTADYRMVDDSAVLRKWHESQPYYFLAPSQIAFVKADTLFQLYPHQGQLRTTKNGSSAWLVLNAIIESISPAFWSPAERIFLLAWTPKNIDQGRIQTPSTQSRRGADCSTNRPHSPKVSDDLGRCR